MDDVKVYIDGVLVPKREARVSVFDHGFLYGDGVFEGVRVYGGIVFRWKQHLDRLYESARSILLDIPMTKEEMTRAVVGTVRANGLRDAYIRLLVSRGVGDLGLDPRKCPRASVIVIVDSIQLYPQELYSKGLRVVTVPTRKTPNDCLSPRIKSMNYLNNILAKVEANLLGYPEVLMMNDGGYVVEGTGDNLFVVDGGDVSTPPLHSGILGGITRGAVMEIAGRTGIAAGEKMLTRHDVYNADECFLTGTAAEIVPVVEVDGRVIGSGAPGPVTKRLTKEFRKLTEVDGEPVYERDGRVGRVSRGVAVG